MLADAATSETVERWQFDIECDKSADNTTCASIAPPPLPSPRARARHRSRARSVSAKSEKAVHAEIQAIIRQITASVSFLPVIEQTCTFEMLIYTDKSADVPETWEHSDGKLINNGEEVFPLRGFSTDIHAVKSAVAYKLG